MLALASAAFLAGYLSVWIGFGAAAALACGGLRVAGLLSPDLALADPALAGALLIGAGLYQLAPLKLAFLEKCRASMGYLRSGSRDGNGVAFVMGARHGAHCIGSWGPLIALLFVVGVLNPVWIAVLALIALAEKNLPFGNSISHAVAVAAIGWGLWLFAGMLA